VSRREWLFCLGLAAATLAVYSGVLSSDFVRFDDPRYVTSNPVVREGLTLDGVTWALTAFVKSNWHPLTLLSHMTDVELYALEPAGHHATSLILHIANALLLFAVLRLATGSAVPSGLVATLFALHPTHVESVAWISERKDVLSTFFWVLVIGAYVAHARRGGAARYALVLLLFALGLTAKPMLVTLPLVLLLLDYWPLERLRFDRSALRPVVEKLPLLALAAGAAYVAIVAQTESGARASGDVVPIPLRLANAVMSYGLYVGKTVWPADLALVYPNPNLAGGTPWQAWQVTLIGMSLVAATAAVLRAHRQRYLAVGWFWFLGTLVPVIGIVQVGTQGIADRYTYVPGIGLYVMVAWGGVALLRRAPRWRAAALACALAGIVALAAVSWRQVGYWRDTIVLFEHSLAVAPGSYLLHNNLANELMDRGHLDESIRHYRRALEIKPDFRKVHNNLSNALRERGEAFEAAEHFLLARQIELDSVEGQLHLGIVRLQEGDSTAALAHFRRAAEFDSDLEAVQLALGNAHVLARSVDEALVHYRRATELAPDSADAHRVLAGGYLLNRNFAGAVEEMREVIRIQPGSAQDLTLLGHALQWLGDLDEAVVHYHRAVEASPDSAAAHRNLGDALMAGGDVDEAIVFYRQAVILEPDEPASRDRLDQALRSKAARVGGAQSEAGDLGSGGR
jgi:tetratricopeptide (TPR) repeat protein